MGPARPLGPGHQRRGLREKRGDKSASTGKLAHQRARLEHRHLTEACSRCPVGLGREKPKASNWGSWSLTWPCSPITLSRKRRDVEDSSSEGSRPGMDASKPVRVCSKRRHGREKG